MLHLVHLILTSLLIPTAHAAMDATAEVTGYVASFDAQTVKLYVDGELVGVPRKAIVKNSRVVVGNQVTAYVETKRGVATETK